MIDYSDDSISSKSDSSQSAVLEGYLRRDELATQLGVSPRTIDRWQVLRCGPPRIAIGRTILYDLNSVREWLRSKEDSANLSNSSRRRQSTAIRGYGR